MGASRTCLLSTGGGVTDVPAPDPAWGYLGVRAYSAVENRGSLTASLQKNRSPNGDRSVSFVVWNKVLRTPCSGPLHGCSNDKFDCLRHESLFVCCDQTKLVEASSNRPAQACRSRSCRPANYLAHFEAKCSCLQVALDASVLALKRLHQEPSSGCFSKKRHSVAPDCRSA